jgi:organic radical activating enzyme
VINHIRAETDITDHCNLRCKNCCHQSPQAKRGFYDLDDYKRDLDTLATAITFKRFGVLGGEPLLNPKVVEYLKYAKTSGITNYTELITNGVMLTQRPDMDHILAVTDCMWVSRYEALGPSVLDRMDQWLADHKSDKIHVVNKPEFWDQYHPEGQSGEQIFLEHGKCDQRIICNMVYKGYYYACAPAARWPQAIAPRRVQIIPDNLEFRLNEFLTEITAFPISTCASCCRSILAPHEFY